MIKSTWFFIKMLFYKRIPAIQNSSLFCLTVYLISIFFSCSDKKENDKKYKGRIELSNQIKVKLDSLMLPITSDAKLFTNKKNDTIISMINLSQNTINYYSISGNPLQYRTIVYKDGPNSFGSIKGYFLINQDSIFISNSFNGQVAIINRDGKIIKKYSMPNNIRNAYYPFPVCESGSEMSKIGSKLYLPSISTPSNPFAHNKKLYTEGFLQTVLDINTSNREFRIKYPNSKLLSKSHFPFESTRVYCVTNQQQKIFLYSFGCDKNIYVYSENGNLAKTKELKSDFADFELHSLGNSSKSNDPFHHYTEYVNNLYYGKLYFDPKSNLYYRFVKHGLNPAMSDNEIKKAKKIELKYSLIIADSNFNKTDEILLEKDIWGGWLTPHNGGFIVQKWIENEDIFLLNQYKYWKK